MTVRSRSSAAFQTSGATPCALKMMVEPFGGLVGLLDEDGALLAEAVYDVLVVDDLVPDVDGSAEPFEREFNDVYRAYDACTEAAGRAKHQLHAPMIPVQP